MVESEEELPPSPGTDVTHVRHLRAKKEHLEKQMEQKMKHRQNIQVRLDVRIHLNGLLSCNSLLQYVGTI